MYLGGSFTQVGSSTRTRAAAVSNTGAVQSWAPAVADGKVAALAVNGGLSRIVLGGSFTKLNAEGSNHRGSGMVDTSSGKTNLPWAVGTKVKDWGTNAGITSLTSDGTNVYGTGFVYGSTGNLEGTFSAPWSTGALRWVEDCHGDSYSSTVLGSAVYIAGHPHYCATIGGFPDGSVGTWHRALSFSTAVTGTIAHNTRPNYPDWFGTPAPSLLHWSRRRREDLRIIRSARHEDLGLLARLRSAHGRTNVRPRPGLSRRRDLHDRSCRRVLSSSCR